MEYIYKYIHEYTGIAVGCAEGNDLSGDELQLESRVVTRHEWTLPDDHRDEPDTHTHKFALYLQPE